MATEASWAEFVAEQAARAGEVRIHRMFGEYALYLDERVVAFLCDNRCFLKPTAAGRALLGPAAEEGLPYPGAKPRFDITDLVEHPARLAPLLRATAAALPPPKRKRGG